MFNHITMRRSPGRRRALLIGGSMVATLVASLGSPAGALPTGGAVAAGSVTIGTGPGQLTVNQSTQNAIINWQSFGIGAKEGVTFVQPNSNAVALNRVLGQDPSAILGSLNANGHIFVVNPNGVLFGQGAQVNVAGLVASTLNITDADFMAGKYRFNGSGGSVVNRGSINANGGYVALLGANVSNEGLIAARLGTVALAAGNTITLDVGGNGLLSVVVDRGAVGARARNGGILRADGGQVIMTANAANSLIRTVVNNTGLIEARSVGSRGGVIMLLGDGGTVGVAGTLDASGRSAGESGGRIVVTGNHVALANATIDASGNAGGGTVLLGGGYRGQDAAVANAATLDMNDGTTVRADALATGSGGTVVAWSNGQTDIAGTISARGATGQGGLVETSGAHVSLASSAFVDTRSTGAATGLWLLDPVNYKIAIAGGDETPSQVTISLANSNRLIIADHDITIADAVTWTTPQTLELRAGNDVLINAAVTASTGGSGFRVVAGRDAHVNAAVTASGLASLVDFNANHDIFQDAAITASGGGVVRLVADADGTGGLAGGTVRLSPRFPVTSEDKTIYYSPENGYGAPNDYTGFKAFMWVFAGALDKVYDGTTPATLAFRGGDPTVGGTRDVRLDGGTANFDNPNVGTLKPVIFSGVGLAGGDRGAYALYAAAGVTAASITPAALTVTATNVGKNYGDEVSFTGTGFTSTGLVNGETIATVTLASAGAPATASVAGAPYAIIPSDATGGTFSVSNYNVNYVNGVLTVTPAILVITADNVSKTYGDALTLSPTSFVATGLKNGDTVGSFTPTSVGAVATAGVAGGPYAISGSDAGGGTYTPGNYVTTYVDGALTVTPAALLVTASDQSKVAGTALVFAGTEFAATGLKNGDTIAGVTLVSSGASDTATVAGSPYSIAASDAVGGSYVASNYATSYVSGSLEVTAATTPGSTPTPTPLPTPTPTPNPTPTTPGTPGASGVPVEGPRFVGSDVGSNDSVTSHVAGRQGRTVAVSGLTPGVLLAVAGGGVRMPVASQIATPQAPVIPGNAITPTTTPFIARNGGAPATLAPAPVVRPRKPDRN